MVEHSGSPVVPRETKLQRKARFLVYGHWLLFQPRDVVSRYLERSDTVWNGSPPFGRMNSWPTGAVPDVANTQLMRCTYIYIYI